MSRARRGTLRVRAQYGPARRLAQQAIYVMNADGTQKKRLSTRTRPTTGSGSRSRSKWGFLAVPGTVEVVTQRITAIVIAGRHVNRRRERRQQLPHLPVLGVGSVLGQIAGHEHRQPADVAARLRPRPPR
jgi:hypothetical protein